jgi:D-alanyl-D-alanine carboxypeptidase/D-alanyl-D-alanine-endopeptidase (penicillin-binding protein 4)
MRPPASVEKLYTSVALLRELGAKARLRTTVLGVGRLGPGGAWRGDLYLRGGGDPTLGDGAFNRAWELGYGPTTAQLAAQLAADGIRRVTGAVIADESLFDSERGGPASAGRPDLPDFGGQLSALTYDHGASAGGLSPAAFAARQLSRALHAAHVRASSAPLAGITPPRARRLAAVSSPRLAALLRLMNIPSDDLFAELLTKQLGARLRGRGSIAAGARVIAQVMASYGLHPKTLDGSGLDRSDRTSPLEVVTLLRQVWHTPVGDLLQDSLPVLGVSGTTRRIAAGTPAQGRCVAKTGTLQGVTNLAGYCNSRGRRKLAFALLIDGPDNSRALGLIGRMAAAIARY